MHSEEDGDMAYAAVHGWVGGVVVSVEVLRVSMSVIATSVFLAASRYARRSKAKAEQTSLT